MTGRLIIDGTDIWTTYGAWLTDQGVNELLSWPASKEVDTVSWAESDYIEADLSSLPLAGREAVITFDIKGYPTDAAALCSFLAGNIYRTWNIASIGRSYSVRYVGASRLEAAQGIQRLAVTVAIDTPMAGYSYSAPVSEIASVNEYSLDGTLLTAYGVRVLLGTLDSTAKPGNVKERLSRDISSVSGIIYDSGAQNALESYEIALDCALIGTTLAGVWKNYDALLYDLTKQNNNAVYDTDKCKRTLHSYHLDADFGCYYRSQSVTGFYPDGGRIWLLFTLTLGIVSSDYVSSYLAAESSEWVNTESSNNRIIV